jgi:hypothetical protein
MPHVKVKHNNYDGNKRIPLRQHQMNTARRVMTARPTGSWTIANIHIVPMGGAWMMLHVNK